MNFNECQNCGKGIKENICLICKTSKYVIRKKGKVNEKKIIL